VREQDGWCWEKMSAKRFKKTITRNAKSDISAKRSPKKKWGINGELTNWSFKQIGENGHLLPKTKRDRKKKDPLS